jgi:hypothetical protein
MIFDIETPPKTLELISASDAAKILGITSRRVRVLANQDRFNFAYRTKTHGWMFLKHDFRLSAGTRGPKRTKPTVGK